MEDPYNEHNIDFEKNKKDLWVCVYVCVHAHMCVCILFQLGELTIHDILFCKK